MERGILNLAHELQNSGYEVIQHFNLQHWDGHPEKPEGKTPQKSQQEDDVLV